MADPLKLLSFKDALSLRGKIAFAEGQTFCRLTSFVAKASSGWATSFARRRISADIELGLAFAIEHLKDAGPRVIRAKSEDPPIYIFTDGACEDETSVGGVLFGEGLRPQAFGCVLADEDIAKWKSKLSQNQVIGQA